jgi:hypothetical protein
MTLPISERFRRACESVSDPTRPSRDGRRSPAAVLFIFIALAALGTCACGTDARGDAEDAPFRSLPELLTRADEVVLGETVSEDRRRLTVRLLVTAKDRLCEGKELALPHPRLATSEGFVRFLPKSRYVYVLFEGVDDVWRVVDSAEVSTFPVRQDKVLVPAFYRPGAALPAKGPPLEIPVDVFFDLVERCQAGREQACRDRFTQAIAGGLPRVN